MPPVAICIREEFIKRLEMYLIFCVPHAIICLRCFCIIVWAGVVQR